MKNKLLSAVCCIGLSLTAMNSFAAMPESGWKAGLSYSRNFERSKEDEFNKDLSSYKINFDGAYRLALSQYTYLEPSASLYFQFFPNSEVRVLPGQKAPLPNPHPLGIGLEPKVMAGLFVRGPIELSTGPSASYTFVQHKDDAVIDNYRAVLWWNFRLGATIAHKINFYVEYKQHLTKVLGNEYAKNRNFFTGGVYYCF